MIGQPEAVAGLSEEQIDALADCLGEFPESYNVIDPSDEQTTMITIPVDLLAIQLAETPWLIDLIAAARAESAREAGEREREACAQVVQAVEIDDGVDGQIQTGVLHAAAAAIRARGTSSEGQAR